MLIAKSAHFCPDMHQVLLLDDTLRLILGHLAPEDHNLSQPSHLCTEGAATLYALARTCQTFCDVALDFLWRQLPSLDPLIRRLPRDAYVVEEGALISSGSVIHVHSRVPTTPTAGTHEAVIRGLYPHTLLWSQGERPGGCRTPRDDARKHRSRGLSSFCSLF